MKSVFFKGMLVATLTFGLVFAFSSCKGSDSSDSGPGLLSVNVGSLPNFPAGTVSYDEADAIKAFDAVVNSGALKGFTNIGDLITAAAANPLFGNLADVDQAIVTAAIAEPVPARPDQVNVSFPGAYTGVGDGNAALKTKLGLTAADDVATVSGTETYSYSSAKVPFITDTADPKYIAHPTWYTAPTTPASILNITSWMAPAGPAVVGDKRTDKSVTKRTYTIKTPFNTNIDANTVNTDTGTLKVAATVSINRTVSQTATKGDAGLEHNVEADGNNLTQISIALLIHSNEHAAKYTFQVANKGKTQLRSVNNSGAEKSSDLRIYYTDKKDKFSSFSTRTAQYTELADLEEALLKAATLLATASPDFFLEN